MDKDKLQTYEVFSGTDKYQQKSKVPALDN